MNEPDSGAGGSIEELSGPEDQNSFSQRKRATQPGISALGNLGTGTVRHGPQKGLDSA